MAIIITKPIPFIDDFFLHIENLEYDPMKINLYVYYNQMHIEEKVQFLSFSIHFRKKCTVVRCL